MWLRAVPFVCALLAAILLVVVGAVRYASHRIATDEVLTPEAARPPGRLVTVRDHRLHVVTLGDVANDPTGVPLLLVHGRTVAGGAALLPWARGKLAPHRTVILPDLLGFGYSQRLTRPGEYYTLHGYSTDLLVLLDQLGVNRVDIVGHGFGATIAARFAIDYPEAVRKIVLMDSVLLAGRSRVENLTGLPLGLGRAAVWYSLERGPFARIRGSTDAQRAMMFIDRHASENDDVIARLGWLKKRTLVIWGAEDAVASLEQGQRLANSVRSPLVAIPGAGHWPYLQQPDVVAKQLLGFLRNASTATNSWTSSQPTACTRMSIDVPSRKPEQGARA